MNQKVSDGPLGSSPLGSDGPLGPSPLGSGGGQDGDTLNAFEALTKSVRPEKALLVKGSPAKKAHFHLTYAANVTSSWYPNMKLVLGGEEESEKNRVLLGPLREETRKLITLDACIALEGVTRNLHMLMCNCKSHRRSYVALRRQK